MWVNGIKAAQNGNGHYELKISDKFGKQLKFRTDQVHCDLSAAIPPSSNGKRDQFEPPRSTWHHIVFSAATA